MGKTVNKKDEIKDVQPIRDLQKIEDMKAALRTQPWLSPWLKRHNAQRDYILFLIGINTGLRITDLLNLKVSDVKKKKRMVVKEGKTQKKRVLNLENIYDEIQAYIEGMEKPSEWLFPSRKGDKPITRVAAYQALNKAAEFAGVESIGTHTLRKTFGYWFYKQYKDVAALQNILNHSKPKVTLDYIGITEEEIEQKLNGFVL